MSELKPCPFCGGQATLNDDGNIGNPLHITCENLADSCLLGFTNLYPRQSEAELVEAWNTRA
ncbi:MAG: Lar family restriction alleviation protein [Proteobacteria bacterium]|nr:Lar family restriction alleviation protein [Pseudomonadota bacterium]